jgi:two-component system cell cycle response regulator
MRANIRSRCWLVYLGVGSGGISVGELLPHISAVSSYVGRNGLHWTAFPAPANLGYLGHYPWLIAGLLVMIRSRRSERHFESSADAVIAGVGFAVLSWVLLIVPSAAGSGSLLVKGTSVAYPVLDLITFLIAIRLLMGGGLRNTSIRLLLSSLVLLFVTDSIYSWMQLNGVYNANKFLDVMWLSYYLILGASALHPSMRLVVNPVGDAVGFGRFRAIALALLTLVTPSIGLVDRYLNLDKDQVTLAVAWGSVLIFVVVGSRVLALINRQRGLLAANKRQAARLSAALSDVQEAQRDRVRLLSDTVEAADQRDHNSPPHDGRASTTCARRGRTGCRARRLCCGFPKSNGRPHGLAGTRGYVRPTQRRRNDRVQSSAGESLERRAPLARPACHSTSWVSPEGHARGHRHR